MRKRWQAAYGFTALVTLATSAVLMACEPRELGAAVHAEWSAAVDFATFPAGSDAEDAGNRVERARLARLAPARS